MNATLAAALTAAFVLGAAGARAAGGPPMSPAQVDAAFTVADTDHSGALDKKEARRLGVRSKAFKSADADGNGVLDKQEFPSAIARRFRKSNPDGDGTLDLAEARSAGVRGKASFDAADRDHDGKLTLDEYLAAMTRQAAQ